MLTEGPSGNIRYINAKRQAFIKNHEDNLEWRKAVDFVTTEKRDTGLPWWRSGKESACQFRGHGFEPWSGKIPHAAEQLSQCATTTEPACDNY